MRISIHLSGTLPEMDKPKRNRSVYSQRPEFLTETEVCIRVAVNHGKQAEEIQDYILARGWGEIGDYWTLREVEQLELEMTLHAIFGDNRRLWDFN